MSESPVPEDQWVERMEQLIPGLQDATSEGDGHPVRLMVQDVDSEMDALNQDTEAVVRHVLFQGSEPDLEERLVPNSAEEMSEERAAQGLVYMDDDDNRSDNSEQVVKNRVKELLNILREASVDGKLYDVAFASSPAAYSYGIVIVSKNNYILGWIAPDCVWT